MRKKILLLFIALLSLICILVACNSGDSQQVKFTLTFDVDGVRYHQISTNGNERIQLPSNPTKSGYVFDGWYWDKDTWNNTFTIDSLINQKLTENITVYAKWDTEEEASKSVVTFVTNGGSLIPIGRYDEINAAPTTVRNGYALEGWYTDSTFSENSKVSFPLTITSDLTLYAKWNLNTYTITYNANDGTMPSEYASSYTIEQSVTLAIPSKVGYDFLGWYDNATFEGSAITSVSTGNYEDKVFCAKWQAINYTITYNLNSGVLPQGAATAYTIESAVNLPTPTRNEYVFAGWFTNAELSGAAVNSISKGNKGNKEFWAKWESSGYSITYNLDGGINGINPPSYNEQSETIALAAPSKTGYTFEGWYDNAGLTGEAVTQIAHGSSGNKELWAKWSINSYTITFETNGGTSISTIEQEYSSSVSAPTTPEKTGYTFIGWYADNTLTKPYIFNTIPAENVTVYAKWTADEYGITYNTDGATLPTGAATKYTIEDTITLPVLEKTGYTFEGWYDNNTFTGEAITEIRGRTRNISLYAKWQINKYIVSFETNGGSVVAPITCSQLTGLPEATRTGYTIEGLYMTADFAPECKITFPYAVTEEQTLYIKWKLNIYTITFNTDDGGVVESVSAAHGSIIEEPAAITKDGSVFNGWYTDKNFANAWNFSVDTVTESITLYAQWITISKGLKFTLDTPTDTYVVTGYSGTDSIIAIPSKYDDKHVTEIDLRVFFGNRWIENIIIPDSVTKIGSEAFTSCRNLKKITMSKKLETLDIRAFWNCEKLESVDLPDTLKNIGSEAFLGCSNLKELNLPTGLTDIGENIIKGCDNLETLTMPGNITLISLVGENIGNVPATLKTLKIAEGSERVVSGAFTDCTMIETVVIPTSVTEIAENIFQKFNIKNLTIPASVAGLYGSSASALESVTIIGAGNISANSFLNCVNLKTVGIGNEIIEIESAAFSGCSSLTSITIPNSVTSIGANAFEGCNGIESATIPTWAITYIPKTNLKTVEITGGTSIGEEAFNGCRGLTSVTIPGSVTSIGNSAFSGCNSLTSITIPNSVTSIGDDAFSGCNGIESATIPTWAITYIPKTNLKTVVITEGTSISANAFSGCSSLMNITIPESVTSIGQYAFYNCSGLTSITIPDSVESIGKSAFEGCSGLIRISLPFVGATKDGTSNTHFGYIFGGGTSYNTILGNVPNNGGYVPSSLKTVVITGGTSIDSYAFFGCSGLTSVTIPSSVTSIGDWAFFYCGGLTSITIPDSVTSIGQYAFYVCSGLTSITIPDSVTSIGNSAFYNCNSLTGVYISDIAAWCRISFGDSSANPLYYARNLYLNNELVTKLVIPDSVTNIGQYAFYNCSGLTSITIPDSVTSIGDDAFRDTGIWNNAADNSVVYADKWAVGYKGTLTSITLETDIVGIGGSAFRDCSSLTSITIPNGVTSIGDDAFSGCNGIESATIPTWAIAYIPKTNLKTVVITGGTSIGHMAFYNCSGLTSITIPDSVTSIDNYAFFGCSGLTSVTIPNSVTSIGTSAFYGCSGLTSITIPSIVTSIGDYAFFGCSGLTSVTIPNSVTSIGDYAFFGCSGLTSVTIPNSVTSIGTSAFYGCSGLTSITIPNSVTSIGNYAFFGCSSFTSITIPKSVTSIGYGAFSGCGRLTSITVEKGNPAYKSEGNCIIEKATNKLIIGCNSSVIPSYITGIGQDAFSGCSGLTSVTIPDGVTSIGNSAFSGCSSLTSITIPDGVTSIGYETFSGCSGLTSVTIADGVTSIGNSAFSGCSSLTSITIPDGVTSIGESAFYECSDLTSVTIPSSVTNIGSSAFSGCNSLTGVYISDIAAWCNISFGDSNANPLSYARNLYLNNELVTELVIPDGVTSIGRYAFSSCSGLTSITIPDSVTSIGRYAFSSCSGLTSITLPFVGATKDGTSNTHFGYIFGASGYSYNSQYVPSSLKTVVITGGASIGNSAFYGCSSLTSITIPDGVTSIGSSAFSGCSSLTSITIPDGVTSIGSSAFSGCSGLTSITIPDRVTSIGNSAFSGCSGLTSITIPDSVTSIGESAFRYCSSLTSITIPENVTSIGQSAFRDTGIWNNTAENSVVYADKWAVGYKGTLTSITLEADTVGIGGSAFRDCSSLTSITIPNGVTSIGDYAFSGCNGIESATIPTLAIAYVPKTNLKTVVITGGASIGNSAFSGCSKLTSVTILESVTSIGDSAFSGCSGLTSITIPDTVTSIGRYAFSSCSGLTSITIPDSVTSIGRYAFSSCSGLTSITLPFVGATKDGTNNTHFGYIFGASGYSSNSQYVPSSLKTVVITGRASIGSYAFYGCSSLTSITISDGVTSIGSSAFSGCSGLTSITIPDSVTSIGRYAFSSCSGLTSITLPFVGATKDGTSNTHFGYIFGASGYSSNSQYVPSNLKTVVITGGASIGNSAFSGCSGLTSITIPDSVTSIGGSAFYNCSGLTSITLPFVGATKDGTSNTHFGYIFGASGYSSNSQYVPSNLKTVVITGGASIGDRAFSGCSGLTSVTIPSSVTSIGSSAFSGCSGLTSITIPDSVTSIGNSAFYNCNSLTGVYISDIAAWCRISFGSSYANPLYYARNLYLNNELVTELVIPDGVTSIGSYAFGYCSSLTSVTIPNSVTNIGSSAFSGCNSLTGVYISDIAAWCNISFGDSNANPLSYARNLYLNNELVTELVIPDSVESIGRYAFYNCSSLMSITIPESVTSIGSSAFSGCSKLTSITIPDSVTSIGQYAFYNCNSLTGVYISDIAAWCKISFGDSSANPLYYARNLYLNNELVTELVIPDSVTNIGQYAFYNCSGLTSITIPDSVTSIGRYAFISCSGLTSITLPFVGATKDGTSNTHFGYIFGANDYSSNSQYVPSNLKTVVITGGASIGSYAFYGCSSLTSITIPDGVTNIGQYAFYNCSGLTSITIPNSVTSIGQYAFEGCNGIESATIPTLAIAYIPKTNLKTVEITRGTSIGSNAFESCSKLTSVTIPGSVTSIGESAFSGCNNLTDITLPFVGATKDGTSNTHFGYIFGASGYSSNSQYVPSSLKTVVITGGASIGEYAFYGCSGLTSITIPDSVTSIGQSAFRDTGIWNNTAENSVVYADKWAVGYKGIVTSVTLKTDIVGIGSYAFSGCSGLTSITIPNSVTSIGSYAFSGCSGLTSITIPNSVTSIGANAFEGCNGIESATIPTLAIAYIPKTNLKTVEITGGASIGYRAFYNCSGLTSVTIPGSVTSIGQDAFYECSGLTSITIPDGVTSIGNSAFSGCSSLTSITIPDGVTSIGYGTFYGCSGLTSVTIADGVTSIGNSAFSGCSSLTSITIPDGVTSIGRYSFSGCNGIESATIPTLAIAYIPKTNLKTIVITEGDSIGNSAFSGCSSLTSITIPNSVTSIGQSAFYNCNSLTGVYISDIAAWCKISFGDSSATPLSYAHNLYLNNELVTELVIPDGVTSIGQYAFSGCSGLTSVTIPSSVTNIGSSAFSGCNSLTGVYISDIAAWCSISFGNGYANPLYYANNLYLNNELVTELVIPDGVTSIGNSAFSGCSSLTSITIPDGVTSIGESAFYECSDLTSVTIADGVTSIGNSAFSGCSSLTSITIPDSVTNIGQYAFYNCSGLTSITIPFVGATLNGTSNTHFGYIFGGGTGYNSILGDVPNNEGYVPSSLKTVVITGGTSIDSYAFYDCIGLTSITLPNNVTSISASAFYNCSGLTSITVEKGNPVYKSEGNCIIEKETNKLIIGCNSSVIPSDITSIGQYAFRGCSGLTSVTIPNSVTSIGESAFSGCNGIESATIPTRAITYIPKTNLKTVVITGGDSIGSNAFESCSSLTSITIPNSVTSISASAFSGCNNLTDITLPFVGGSLKTSSDTYQYPFGYIFGTTNYTEATAVEQYYYGSTTNSTTSDTYYIPSSLRSVTITGGEILYGAFYNCAMLTSITIPDSVTSIGSNAFYNCKSLTGVYISDIAAWCNISFGDSNANPLSYARNLYLNNELVKELVIPDGVTSIGGYAFYNCSGLTSITIPESVTNIGKSAFSGCNGLVSVVVPNSVQTMGSKVFNDCCSLEELTIPFLGASRDATRNAMLNYIFTYDRNVLTDDDMTIGITLVKYSLRRVVISDLENATIYANAFKYWVYLLKEIRINGTVSSVHEKTFSPSEVLEGDIFRSAGIFIDLVVIWENMPKDCNLPDDEGVTHIDKNPNNSDIIDYEIEGQPGAVLRIMPNNDFYGVTIQGVSQNNTATNIVIPETIIYNGMKYTVTRIGDIAFNGCSSLTSITIPDSVTNIGACAFFGCTADIIWGANPRVTSIGAYVFGNYKGSSVTIPDSVTGIGSNAFSGCTADIRWGDNPRVINIGAYVFSNYKGSSLTIPDTVISIGAYAFSGCTADIIWGANPGVTSIGAYVFGNYKGSSLIIPNSVTSIGSNAFSGCTADIIWGERPSVTSIGEDVFKNYKGSSLIIPNSVTEIANGALSGCSNLVHITLPFVGANANATDSEALFGYIFGETSFDGASGIEQQYKFNNIFLRNKTYYIPTGLRSVAILRGTIGYGAFSSCNMLKVVKIGTGVIGIDSNAFDGCSGLTTINCEAASQPSNWSASWKNGCNATVIWGYKG